MPTNDPTAPRVLDHHACVHCNHHANDHRLDDPSPCMKCGCEGFQHFVHRVSPKNAPAPRVVGGGAQCEARPWYNKTERCTREAGHSGWHSTSPEGHRWGDRDSSAVLPEEGTTPPMPIEEALRHVDLQAVSDELDGSAGSLRETGAGRGEARTIRCPALASYGENAYRQCEKADGHDGLHRYDLHGASAEWARSHHFLAGTSYLAASPEGGAPTAEPTLEGIAAAIDKAAAPLGPMNHDKAVWLARHSVVCQAVAHVARLTRSPRAAGEPSDLDAEIMAQTEAELFEANNALVLLANEFERRSIPFIPAAEKATAAARAYISEHAASVEMGMKIAMQVFAERRPAAPPPERAP